MTTLIIRKTIGPPHILEGGQQMESEKKEKLTRMEKGIYSLNLETGILATSFPLKEGKIWAAGNPIINSL